VARRKADDVEVASAVGNDDDQGDDDVAMAFGKREDGSPFMLVLPRPIANLSGELREVVIDMQQLVTHRQRLLHELDVLVAQARELGASWAVIGWSTGMSQQAATKRWSGKEPGL
jgi:hypothetical protein